MILTKINSNWIGLLIGLAIITIIILGVIAFFVIRPYFIRHDTTMLFTGGLGSGKTLESVKRAIVLIRKQRLFKYHWPKFKNQIKRFYRFLRRKTICYQFWHGHKFIGTCRPKPKNIKYPYLYSNIPVHFKKHLWSFKREWSKVLDVEHIMLLKEINEYSVVLIDEFPQFIDQFMWDEKLVQTNCAEFITFFRHYIGGYLILNAQSEDEIECHFRRKLNIGTWCYNMKIWPCRLLPLFYTNRMCDFMLSDNITTMSTTYIEDNTRLHFGLFPRKAYDSRCYRPRYKKVHTKIIYGKEWRKLTTTKVLRIKNYTSPLDDKTTVQQIEAMEREATRLERNEQ